MLSPRLCSTRHSLHKRLILTGLYLILLIVFAGCSTHASRTQELLTTDFQSVGNDSLLLHYYEVEDQIRLAEQRRSSPAVSFGLGLGSFGGRSSVGAGVGVSTPVGQPETAADLRAHRNRVRLELKKRGITP